MQNSRPLHASDKMTPRQVWLAALLLTTSAAHADGDLARCRALTDAAARLACYDALLLGPSAAPTAQFGFSTPAPNAATEAIESYIPGRFDGWEAKARFELANGQVWQIIDSSRAAYVLQDPKIRIRRGAFGAYFMDIEGQESSPKVKRLR